MSRDNLAFRSKVYSIVFLVLVQTVTKLWYDEKYL